MSSEHTDRVDVQSRIFSSFFIALQNMSCNFKMPDAVGDQTMICLFFAIIIFGSKFMFVINF